MTVEDAIRVAVREEVRNALRELLPELARPVVPTAGLGVYLSTADAAELANVRPETIRGWIADGRLPGHRAGREWRVRRDELETLMAHGRERAAVELDLDARAQEILGVGKAKGR